MRQIQGSFWEAKEDYKIIPVNGSIMRNGELVMIMEILEELKQFKCGNEDFERGFATAINIITALNKKDNVDTKHINDLKREIAKLQLRIAVLEAREEPNRCYPYVTKP